jgi:hypothetical protein
MRELDSNGRRGQLLHRIDDTRERPLGLIRAQGKTGGRDAARQFHAGRLHEHQPGATDGEVGQVCQMPVGRDALDARVLAHRGNRDAVRQLQRTQG